MRIWYQGFIDLSTVPRYEPALRRHLDAIGRDDVEVAIHGMAPGSYEGTTPAEVARHAYLTYLHTNQLIDNARRAEREGFDAFVIGIIQNPGLRIIRTMVDIPVVGYGEAAMHLACLLGRRFAVLAFNPDLFPLLEDDIRDYGLTARAAPMEIIEIDYAMVTRALEEPAPVVAAFQAAARRAVANGADVLIPGQMILADILWHSGVQRVEDAPVIDALGASIKMAELLVSLRQQSGVWHARRGYWGARPPEHVVEQTRSRYLAGQEDVGP